MNSGKKISSLTKELQDKILAATKKVQEIKTLPDFLEESYIKRKTNLKCISCFYFSEHEDFYVLQQNCRVCTSLILAPGPGEKALCQHCAREYNLCISCMAKTGDSNE